MNRHVLVLLASLSLLFATACGDDAAGGGSGGSGASSSSGTGGGAAGGASAGGGQGGDAQGGGASGGSGGGSGQGGSGGGSGALGDPIVAPAGQWTWVDFADAHCANGQPTGLAINPGSSSRALIYLMGGGACWDHDTCYVDPIASNISSGFDGADFDPAAALLQEGPFDRNDPLNPFRDDSLVWIPYCTGDIYSGSQITVHGGIPTEHVGYNNIGAYLHRLVPTFAAASQVVLSGGSAGGFGSLFNWDRAQIAFAPTRVDLIDDSGHMLPHPYFSETLEQTFDAAWGMKANLPPDCPSCQDDPAAIYGFAADKYPNNRAALLTYYADNVIASYLSITVPEFTQGVAQLAPIFNSRTNLNAFGVDAVGHVMMRAGWGQLTGGGIPLRQWITLMVDDDPSWTMALD